MKVIVGISGASGAIIGYKTLLALRAAGCETHLVVTDSAYSTWEYETEMPRSRLIGAADFVYDIRDMGAAISSGSFVTDGMIVAPCSMKTLAGIVSGYSDNLLLRAADVCLKENRRVVLCPREMPLGKVHLRNLSEAAGLGCAIVPPMLTFYHRPETIDDMVSQVVGKLLLQLGIEAPELKKWGGAINEH